MIKGDKILFYIALILVVFGFLALSSASLGLTINNSNNFFSTPLRQLILGVGVGGSLFLIFNHLPYQFWRKISLFLFLIGIGLMLMVSFSSFGTAFHGAKRWLIFGPLSFQPAEFLKFSFLVYLSSWLYSHKKDVPSVKFGFGPFLLMTAAVGFLLMLQRDLSTLLVISLGAGFLFFLAGGQIKQLGIMFLLGISIFFILIIFEPYRFSRVLVFLNPQYDAQGAGYQINQALIAVGSGGLFGRGFGMSAQKFNYLPEPTSDSIFAAIGEEFGFLGTSILILFFLFFLWRGLSILNHLRDPFGRFLGSGIVILIVSQSFINISGILGLIPLVGLPLPFVSQGGSALAMNLAEIGILLNITRQIK